MQQIEYPTKWFGGKSVGSINIRKKGDTELSYVFRVNINNETHSKYFYFEDHKGKDNALKVAEEYREYINEKYGLRLNKICHVDKDTIKVDMDNGLYMITDAKHIDIINKYKIGVKKKTNKTNTKSNTNYEDNNEDNNDSDDESIDVMDPASINKNDYYYVVCRKLKEVIPFTKLITNSNQVRFNNGNTLDCRLSNMSFTENTDDNIDYYELSKQTNYDKLPKNIWILGKPLGTWYRRKGENDITLTVGKQSVTIKSKDYKTPQDAEIQAERLKYNLSHKHNLTENEIKINGKIIEVKYKNIDKIFKTDMFMIPFVQKHLWSEYKNRNTEYCATYQNNKYVRFSKLIFDQEVYYMNNDNTDETITNMNFIDTIQLNNCYKILRTRIDIIIPQLEINRSYELTNNKESEIMEYVAYLLDIINQNSSFIYKKNKYLVDDDLEKCKTYLLNHINIIKQIKIKNDLDNSVLVAIREHMKERINKINNRIELINKIQKSLYDESIKIDDKKEITNPLENFKKANNKMTRAELIDRDRCIKKYRDIITKNGGTALFEDSDYVNAQTKLKVKCKDGHEFMITPSNLNINRWCPICKTLTSELIAIKSIEHMLKAKFIKTHPKDLINDQGHVLEFDGFNEELNIAIEYNGIQHYEHVDFFHRDGNSLEKQQRHDQIKIQYCKDHNINLIVVPFDIDDIPKFIYDELCKLGYEVDNYKDFDVNVVRALKSKQDEISALILSKNGKWLNGEYMNRDSKLTLECDKHHQFTTSYKQLFTNKSWCDKCAHFMTDDRKTKIADGMKKYLESEVGKQKKAESFAKRSITMAQQKQELRATITEKYCGYCKETHPIDNFGNKSDAKDGKQVYCRKAYQEIKKLRRTKQDGQNDQNKQTQQI